MAIKKISDVPKADKLLGTNKVPLGQGGTAAVTATISQIVDFAKESLDIPGKAVKVDLSKVNQGDTLEQYPSHCVFHYANAPVHSSTCTYDGTLYYVICAYHGINNKGQAFYAFSGKQCTNVYSLSDVPAWIKECFMEFLGDTMNVIFLDDYTATSANLDINGAPFAACIVPDATATPSGSSNRVGHLSLAHAYTKIDGTLCRIDKFATSSSTQGDFFYTITTNRFLGRLRQSSGSWGLYPAKSSGGAIIPLSNVLNKQASEWRNIIFGLLEPGETFAKAKDSVQVLYLEDYTEKTGATLDLETPFEAKWSSRKVISADGERAGYYTSKAHAFVVVGEQLCRIDKFICAVGDPVRYTITTDKFLGMAQKGDTDWTLYATDGRNTLETILGNSPADWSSIILSLFVEDVASKLTELRRQVGELDNGTLYDKNNPVYGDYVGVAYRLPKTEGKYRIKLSAIGHGGAVLSVKLTKSISPYSSALVRYIARIPLAMSEYQGDFDIYSTDLEQAEYIMIHFDSVADGQSFNSTCYLSNSLVGELNEKQSKLVVGENLDDSVKIGSNNPVTSDAVAQHIAKLSGVIDDGTTYNTPTGNYVVAYYDLEGLMAKNLNINVTEHNDGVTLLYKLTSSKSPYTSAVVANIGQWKTNREFSFIPKDIPTDSGRDISTAKYLAIHAPANTMTSFKVRIECTDGDVITGVGRAKEAISSVTKNTGVDIKNIGKTAGATPMVTWVDDDGIYEDVEKIKGILDELGICITFAVIPPLADIAHGSTTRAEYFNALQRNGHHITAHPNHDGWYESSSYHYNIALVEPSLIDCLTDLQKNGMLHSDMLVYPGSSNGNAQIRAIVEKWCECGVTAGYNQPNHLGESTRWQIKRCFVDFTAHPLSWYKSMVDECKNGGDWLIFGTHSAIFTDSDEGGENANTTANLKLLMQYVKSQNIGIYTLWDAYRKRKILYDMNEFCS